MPPPPPLVARTARASQHTCGSGGLPCSASGNWPSRWRAEEAVAALRCQPEPQSRRREGRWPSRRCGSWQSFRDSPGGGGGCLVWGRRLGVYSDQRPEEWWSPGAAWLPCACPALLPTHQLPRGSPHRDSSEHPLASPGNFHSIYRWRPKPPTSSSSLDWVLMGVGVHVPNGRQRVGAALSRTFL